MIRGLVLQPIVTTRLKLKSQSHIVRCDIPDQVVARFLLVSFAQHSRVELVVNLSEKERKRSKLDAQSRCDCSSAQDFAKAEFANALLSAMSAIPRGESRGYGANSGTNAQLVTSCIRK